MEINLDQCMDGIGSIPAPKRQIYCNYHNGPSRMADCSVVLAFSVFT